jgi:ADP-ribose pyrophosphatase
VSPFRVVDSTTRWRTPVFTLDDVEVADPDGATFTRTIVRHPGAVVVVPIDDTGRVIFVRQYRAAIDGNLLEVVAGKRDVEGEAPELTAQRELAEEVMHRAGRLVLLGEFYNSPGFTDEYSYVYGAFDLAELDGPQGVTEEEAAMTIERHQLADVERLIADREVIDAKSIIGLLLVRRHLAGT